MSMSSREWMQNQTTNDFAILLPDRVERNYTATCPECGMSINLTASDDEENEMFDFDCEHCSTFGCIEFNEEEDDKPWELN
jgi:hypothetical protein